MLNKILEEVFKIEEKMSLIEKEVSLTPPKKWWDKMYKKALAQYKDAETARKVVGDIWYHELDDEKRSEIRKREGKVYGQEESVEFDELSSQIDEFIKKVEKYDIKQ